jgi:RNA polymerase sigma factor (TIGR02999 family)
LPGESISTAQISHSAPSNFARRISWLRLQVSRRLAFEDRGHFMAHAARVMRSVSVDLARRSLAERRGGGAEIQTLDTAVEDSVPAASADPTLVDVADAIDRLAALEPRLAQVVEMRYFAGMGDAEIGDALGLAERTVRRDWEKARAFLKVALAP